MLRAIASKLPKTFADARTWLKTAVEECVAYSEQLLLSVHLASCNLSMCCLLTPSINEYLTPLPDPPGLRAPYLFDKRLLENMEPEE